MSSEFDFTTATVDHQEAGRRALEKERQKLRVALEAVELGIWTYTFADQSWEVDERARELYGLDRLRAVHNDETVRAILHPDDLEPMWRAVRAASDPAGQGQYSMEYRARRAGGGYRWLRAWGRVEFEVRNGQRAPIRMTGASRDITVEKEAELELAKIRSELAAELADMQRLHRLSTRLSPERDFQVLLQEILQASVDLVGSEMGCLQLLDESRGVLTMNAAIGYGPGFVEFFKETRPGQAACGTAWQRGERVIVEDTRQSPLFAERGLREVAERANFRAVCSTPLFSRAGGILGTLSVNFRNPHRPGERELRMLDLYCRQASEVLDAAARQRERQQGENALRDNAQFVRRILDSLFTFVGVLTPDGTLVEANRAPLAAAGISAGDVLGRKFWDCYWWSYSAEVQRQLREAVERASRGEVSRYDVPVRMAGESLMWIEFQIAPLRNSEGQITHLIPSAMDLTERKRVEGALKWSARRDELLSQTAARLLQSGDPQSLVEALCREVLDFLDCHAFFNFLADEPAKRLRLNACAGIPEEEARKIEWLDYGVAVCGCVARDGQRIIAEDIQNSADPRTVLIKSYGIQAYCCHPLQVRDRLIGTLSFATRSRPRFSPAEIEVMKAVSSLVAIAMHRIETEAALRQSESFHRQILESIPGLVFTTRPDGYCDYQSQPWADYTGVPLAEHLGDGWNKLLHPEDQPRALAAWREAVAGRSAYNLEYRVRRRDGVYEWFRVIGRPLRDPAGQIARWFGVAMNIEALKQMEFSLVKARDAAEAANQAKSQFLAAMSHELRTPMTAILGMTDLALQQPLPLQARDFLKTAQESAHHLLEILNEILDFSRIEAGRFELEYTSFRLRDLIEQTVRALGVRAYEKGVELVYHLGDSLPEQVKGDCLRLRQVLTNLLGNAIKFTHQGEIVLGAELERQEADRYHLRFSVRDTGIGISPGNLEKIFAPFTQADASTTRHYGGSGLGLAICRRLVQLMGGRIWAESQLGQGSTFFFTVALPPAEEESSAPPELSYALRDALRDLPVLVVAASEAQQRMLEQMLASWSLRPESVADVPNALAKIHQAAASGRNYRLVLAEAGLTPMGGFALADWLGKDAKLAGPVLLLLSASDRRQHPEVCQTLAPQCVDKPLSRSGLLNAILQALELRPNLPAASPPSASAPAPPPLRILLADDTPANQKLVSHVLGGRGHHLAVTSHGKEALALLDRQDFDLILMDVQMPELDGFEATRAIRALSNPAKARVPIVALTAHALKGDKEKCLEAGMTAYLSKPIKAEEMIEMVERLARPIA